MCRQKDGHRLGWDVGAPALKGKGTQARDTFRGQGMSKTRFSLHAWILRTVSHERLSPDDRSVLRALAVPPTHLSSTDMLPGPGSRTQ